MFLPQASPMHHVQRRASLLHSPVLPLQAACSPQPPASPPSSRMQLKFGMDRILSGDISPSRRRTLHAGGSPKHPNELQCSRPSSVGHLGHDDGLSSLTSLTCSESSSGVPCSECVSSLLRCCSVSVATTPPLATPTPTYAFYPSLHHLPPPHHAAPPPHFASIFSTEPPPSAHLLHPQATKASSVNNSSTTPGGKRKRSWSRAVFSNLQRKGLEKRFQLQKYITKPDRRQLAATLGLTDAQVKVWFQNRRMKWRHSKEAKQQQQAAAVNVAVIQQPADSRGPACNVLAADEERRAADSTQLDGATSDDSDIDIEVDS